MNNNFTDQRTNDALLKFYQACLSNQITVRNLFAEDGNRHADFVIDDCNCYLDFSKNWIDHNSLTLLYKIADNSNLVDKIDGLFNGHKLNYSEDRAALHTALRDLQNLSPINEIHTAIESTHIKIKDLEKKLHNNQLLGFSNKPIKTIVNIGIGGSDLGPKMVYHALRPYWNNNIKCHFVSNIDPSDINFILEKADPETTLFIISSKSFTTTETLANANAARKWLLKYCSQPELAKHFIAITSNMIKAHNFGITPDNILPIWDWVGGRYSVWSAIGLTIALGTSYDTYLELLNGANKLDQHFKNKPWSENMPVTLALLGIGYINYANCQTQAILPYSKNLEYFPDYIQQLDMESNGKSVDIYHNVINYKTAPIVWGATGTNGQHAFYQLLHQGNHLVPCDFIIPLSGSSGSSGPHSEHEFNHKTLVANAFAQTKTLMDGYNHPESPKYKLLAGNKPSNTLLLPKLTPYYLGILIALYEHKIFVQGVIWKINSFDQWGVEQGKVIAQAILENLDYNSEHRNSFINLDPSTIGLIKKYQEKRET